MYNNYGGGGGGGGGWEQTTTPDGDVYYHNAQTGATAWERPPEMGGGGGGYSAPPTAPGGYSAPPPAPGGAPTSPNNSMLGTGYGRVATNAAPASRSSFRNTYRKSLAVASAFVSDTTSKPIVLKAAVGFLALMDTVLAGMNQTNYDGKEDTLPVRPGFVSAALAVAILRQIAVFGGVLRTNRAVMIMSMAALVHGCFFLFRTSLGLDELCVDPTPCPSAFRVVISIQAWMLTIQAACAARIVHLVNDEGEFKSRS